MRNGVQVLILILGENLFRVSIAFTQQMLHVQEYCRISFTRDIPVSNIVLSSQEAKSDYINSSAYAFRICENEVI